MPLLKTIQIDQNGRVFLWNVTETEAFLAQGIALTPNSEQRLRHMKSALHRRAYLSIRHLLALAGYTDHHLYYDAIGKPHLKDGSFVSISHSFTQTALVVHKNIPVGIDIERMREKILRIAHKFTVFSNKTTAGIPRLTHLWAAKEAIYKMAGQPGLSFLNGIEVFWPSADVICGRILSPNSETTKVAYQYYQMYPFLVSQKQEATQNSTTFSFNTALVPHIGFAGVWGWAIKKASAREGQIITNYNQALKALKVY